MMTAACHREEELLDALGNGLVGPELAAHVADCHACGELQLVAGALLDDRSHAISEASVPSAGTIWWRMQLRLRHEAQAAARRSLLIGQAASLLIALTLVASFFGSDLIAGAREVAASIRLSPPLLIAFAAALLTAPIGGYVALRQK